MHAFETTATAGQPRPAELAVTLSALHGRHGGLEGLIAIVRDITAQREVEKQLRQSERLTALGQLAGGIAHDFNNLLQAILGYAQLMKQNPRDAEFVARSLNIVEAAAVDGSETVRRIQQFARLRPDEQFVGVDVNQIVHDAVAIVRPRWEEKIARDNRPLDLRLDLGSIETINGRPAALTELMTNLILNALDAMPDGGTLTITTRGEPRQQITLTEILRSVGHTVTAAASGAAGVAAYGPGRFDVVLSNLGMAGMNGWELAERLRRVDSDVVILFITGWGLRDEEHGRLKMLKIRKCLFKPVRPGELDAAIQDALAAV